MTWKIKNVPNHHPETFIVAGTAASFSSRIRWTRSWFSIGWPKKNLELFQKFHVRYWSQHFEVSWFWKVSSHLSWVICRVVCFIWVIWKNWPWSRCIRHYKINGAASLGSVARLQKFQNMTFQVWTSKGRGCWQITGSTLTRDPTIVGCGWWMATQGKMLLDQGLPSGACHNLLWWIRSPKNDQTAHANTWGLPMTWVWINTY